MHGGLNYADINKNGNTLRGNPLCYHQRLHSIIQADCEWCGCAIRNGQANPFIGLQNKITAKLKPLGILVFWL